jgi:hypothetical protein
MSVLRAELHLARRDAEMIQDAMLAFVALEPLAYRHAVPAFVGGDQIRPGGVGIENGDQFDAFVHLQAVRRAHF